MRAPPFRTGFHAAGISSLALTGKSFASSWMERSALSQALPGQHPVAHALQPVVKAVAVGLHPVSSGPETYFERYAAQVRHGHVQVRLAGYIPAAVSLPQRGPRSAESLIRSSSFEFRTDATSACLPPRGHGEIAGRRESPGQPAYRRRAEVARPTWRRGTEARNAAGCILPLPRDWSS